MTKNKALHKAKKEKNDEFYTQYEEIEEELENYKNNFKDKIVCCNCDNPQYSNFYKYFKDNFKILGLKKLICTYYNSNGNSYKTIFRGNDKSAKMSVVPLIGNGDFRSLECIEILKECDIVVTNPPFSLFREYIGLLMEYNKQFLIIGNVNAITYKEVFPLIKDNKLWLGASIHSGDREFGVPDSYPLQASGFRVDEKGRKYIRVKGVRWFTNIEHSKRNERLVLNKYYKPEEYPKYDNYDAIEVSKVAEIPYGYDGIMGVPITFLDKYNPKQFEIVSFRKGNDGKDLSVNGRCPYFRILIKKKQNMIFSNFKKCIAK